MAEIIFWYFVRDSRGKDYQTSRGENIQVDRVCDRKATEVVRELSYSYPELTGDPGRRLLPKRRSLCVSLICNLCKKTTESLLSRTEYQNKKGR